jgi:hypothetical protein
LTNEEAAAARAAGREGLGVAQEPGARVRVDDEPRRLGPHGGEQTLGEPGVVERVGADGDQGRDGDGGELGLAEVEAPGDGGVAEGVGRLAVDALADRPAGAERVQGRDELDAVLGEVRADRRPVGVVADRREQGGRHAEAAEPDGDVEAGAADVVVRAGGGAQLVDEGVADDDDALCGLVHAVTLRGRTTLAR